MRAPGFCPYHFAVHDGASEGIQECPEATAMFNKERLQAIARRKLAAPPPQLAGAQERLDARVERAREAAKLEPLWKPLCMRHLHGKCNY